MSPYGKAITDADSGVAGRAAMFSTRPGSRGPGSDSPALRGATTGERADGQTVLVVNDQADVTELMSLQLRAAGYQVLTAADGREGYGVAEAERPDLIISDVVMPRADGIELCRLIRAHPRLQTTPVLLVSALRYDSESVVEGLKAGADDYLESPYDKLHLLTRAAQLTERSRAAEVEPLPVVRVGEHRLAPIGEGGFAGRRQVHDAITRGYAVGDGHVWISGGLG